MLLALNIGNSRIGVGLFPYARGRRGLRVRSMPSRPASVPEFRAIVGDLLRPERARGPSGRRRTEPVRAIVSSVVPSVLEDVMPAVREVVAGEPLVVGRSLNNGLTFAVKHPEQVGADRITCAVAAVALLGCPVAVVDLGTATTVSVVGKRNEFLGGAILPGLTLMRDALSRGTAQLPDIALRRPRAIVGGDTVSAILSGIMYGTAGAIERLVAGMEKAHRFRVHLVLTGGHARFLSPLLARPHVTRPMLAFEGLRLIYLRNLVHIREDAIS